MAERPFDRIGAEPLRAVLRDFYDRVFDDVMIGFLFRRADKARLVELEWQFTARMLGATEVPYQGRSMPAAHRSSPILGGHFARRQTILEEVLERHGVDPEVRRLWLEHNVRLRPQVTADSTTECNDLAVHPATGDDPSR